MGSSDPQISRRVSKDPGISAGALQTHKHQAGSLKIQEYQQGLFRPTNIKKGLYRFRNISGGSSDPQISRRVSTYPGISAGALQTHKHQEGSLQIQEYRRDLFRHTYMKQDVSGLRNIILGCPGPGISVVQLELCTVPGI